MRHFLVLIIYTVLVSFIILFFPVGYSNAIADDPITITVFCGTPGNQPSDDNKIYQLIEDRLGVKFDFQFLSGDLDRTLQSIVKSGNYPDLLYAEYSVDTVIQAGGFVNLLDYINPNDTPRLWAHIESQRTRIIQQDGKGNEVLYIIPDYGLYDDSKIVNEVSGTAFFLQKKVLADAGYPDVKDITIDEYFDLIENYMTNHPTNEDGVPYQGFVIMCEGWRHFCLKNPVQNLMGRPNDGDVIVDISTSEYTTETFINQPYAKAYYKKLNEAYQKGLISRDTFVMDYDQYIAALKSGTVLGMFDQGWDFGDATTYLLDMGKYENTYMALGPVYSQDTEGIPEGWDIEEHYLNGTGPNINQGYGISIQCEDPERIVAMWEEMMSDEWQLLLNWGVEGEDFLVDDGRLIMTEEQYANTLNEEWRRANKADALFRYSPKMQGTISSESLFGGNSWEPDYQSEIVYSLMNDYDKSFLDQYGYTRWSDFFNPPIEIAPYGEAWEINLGPIQDDVDTFLCILDEQLPAIIMAADNADFDSKWGTMIAEIEPYADIYTRFMQEEILKLVEGNGQIVNGWNNFQWTLSETGALEVVGEGEMPTTTAPWESRKDEITSIVLSSGITSISSTGFRDSVNLKSIMIPESVERIYHDAFRGCCSLERVILPDCVSSIGEYAFYDCSMLQEVRFPSDLITIKSFAFTNCIRLQSIHLPNGLQSIGQGAFFNCSGAKSISIPDSVYSIGDEAFQFCQSITRIDIPGSIINMGNNVFCECSNLQRASFLNGAIHTGSSVFNWCGNLVSISLPDSIQLIDNNAFDYCSSLKNLVIPASVTMICDDAFNNCYALEKICILGKSTSIGELTITGNPVVYCYRDSNAEAWADEQDLEVVFLDDVDTSELLTVTLPETINILLGQETYLNANVFCLNPIESMTWESGDSSIVCVNEDGVLLPQKEGSAIVTLTINGISASTTVNVFPQATNIRIPFETIYGILSKDNIFEVEVYPQNAYCDLYAELADADYGYVDFDGTRGYITGFKVGYTYMTITEKVTGIQVEVPVRIYRRIASVDIEKERVSIKKGNHADLVVTVTTGNNEIHNQLVYWVSNDDTVVEVDPYTGRITGHNPGTATICAYAQNDNSGDLSDSCTVFVVEDTQIQLPSDLREIHEESFMGTKCGEYIIPASVQTIGPRAFAELKSRLSRIVINAESINISNDAFENSNVIIITSVGSQAAIWAEDHDVMWAED